MKLLQNSLGEKFQKVYHRGKIPCFWVYLEEWKNSISKIEFIEASVREINAAHLERADLFYKEGKGFYTAYSKSIAGSYLLFEEALIEQLEYGKNNDKPIKRGFY